MRSVNWFISNSLDQKIELDDNFSKLSSNIYRIDFWFFKSQNEEDKIFVTNMRLQTCDYVI